MFGMKKYNDFSERKRLLSDIFDGAVKIKNLLRCACPPMHESFLSGGEFFEAAAAKIREGTLPDQAVEDTMMHFPVLKDDDRVCILRFAHGLDATDREGQLSNLEIFINDTQNALAKAETELNTKGKLYVKGSMLTAAAVVLFLI